MRGNQDDLDTIRITKDTKAKIIKLATQKGLKHITVLEYLLNGKIRLEELTN